MRNSTMGPKRFPQKLKMIVGCDGGLPFDETRCLAPRRSLPVVLPFFRRNPRRQGLAEVVCERVDVRLIHAAQVRKPLVGGSVVVQLESVLCEHVTDVLKFGVRQAVRGEFLRRSVEDLREIYDGVTSDGKSELGLSFAGTFYADHDQCAGVKNGGKRGDPGLIVVLRAEKRQHGIGQMALHEFGAPEFPFLQQFAKRVLPLRIAVTTKQLAGGWRCAGARIEQGNIYFAFRE